MRLTIRAFSQALSGPDFAIPKVIKAAYSVTMNFFRNFLFSF